MEGFLYMQSEYSFLNSMNKIEAYVKRAKEYGYSAINITDPNMHGAYKFYKKCKENKIKPIIGLKISVKSESRIESVLLAYAMNEKGYKSLLELSSIQAIEKLISLDELAKRSQYLAIVTPGIEGEAEKDLLDGLDSKAGETLIKYKKLFKRLYVGISLNDIAYEIAPKLFDLANSLGISCLPVNRCLYLDKEDKEYYKYFKAIGDNKISNVDGEYHLYKKNELKDLYNGFYDLNEIYKHFINSIDIEIQAANKTLPIYPSNKSISSKSLLEQLSYMGLKKRLNGKIVEEYIKRLDYELKVISNMGYDDYFLIVYDFIKYAKQNGIMVGPGRGSAAGSLVSYCLGITNVDPIRFDLLFERFLNPERISMPDIDVDFADDRRNDVITYVKNKYGKKHVCYISTFNRYQSKSAIRDIAGVLQIEKTIVDAITSKISDEDNIKEFIENNPELMSNEQVSRLLMISSKIEELPKHIGTHASGIIISDEELIKNTAITAGMNELYQSQFEFEDLEELGLLKIDFLSLKNLSIVSDIVNNVKININKISLDDKKTYSLLANADTQGIFQLESRGISNVLLKLKPNCIDDIIAVLALYRPGPMDQIDEYIERKNGKKYETISPIIEDILKPTYGIIVYQEQIIKIAAKYAGYSLGEADVLRRAISKKNIDLFESERKTFIRKSTAIGRNKDEADKIYDYIVKFANYGFNKSHSVAYGILCYQMAYLKVNYFKYFIVALLNNSINSATALKDYIRECNIRNIKIKSIDINISTDRFIVQNDEIYFPFTGIKGFGYNNCKKILIERKNGNFKSFYDFKRRVALNEQLLESLIFAGAFDNFGTKKQLLNGKDNDFELMMKHFDDAIVKNEEYGNSYLYKKEQEALGLNIKYNIFDDYKDIIKKEGLKTVSKINDKYENVIALVESVNEIKTKNGELMAFLTISDDLEKRECVMFPKCYKQLKNEIKYGIILKVRVKNDVKDGKKSLIIEDALILGK